MKRTARARPAVLYSCPWSRVSRMVHSEIGALTWRSRRVVRVPGKAIPYQLIVHRSDYDYGRRSACVSGWD
jgi:hypothetical protein